MLLATQYTMPMIGERNTQIGYELRAEAEETVEHQADNALTQPDCNMNNSIMATRHPVGLWLVSPLTTSYVSHKLISTVSIAVVGYKLLYMTPFLLIDFV